MPKSPFIAFALMLALTGCAVSGRDQGQLTLVELGERIGLDTRNFDTSVRPSEDFYRWVNGRWLALVEVPADAGSYGPFTEAADRTGVRLRTMVREIAAGEGHQPNSDRARIKALYHLFQDRERIEARGAGFLVTDMPELWQVGGAGGSNMAALLARLMRLDMSLPIKAEVRPDLGGSGRYLLILSQAGLGLPDRRYYTEKSPEGAGLEPLTEAPLVEDYEAYVAEIFTLLGLGGGAERAAGVLAIERALAAAQWSRVESRDLRATYNPVTRMELANLAPGFDWQVFLQALGVVENQTIVLKQPDFFTAFARLAAKFSDSEWSDYFLFHLTSSLADALPAAFYEARFKIYFTRLRGITKKRSLEQRAVSFIDRMMGEALGRLYVERHFSEADKKAVAEIAANVRAGFRRRLRANSWMSAATRRQALDKLEKMEIRVGYPEVWADYSGFTVKAGSLLETMLAGRRYKTGLEFGRLGEPATGARWNVRPHSVNAFYRASLNQIILPAGILQPPFYNPDGDLALNFGAIGGIIGHEMVHAFDDQGRKTDGDGTLRDWWSAEDAAKFEKRAGALVRQYERFEALPGVATDGKLTLGENMGDLGGILAAFEGYRMARSGRDARLLGMTGDQRFFAGWAQIWRRLYTQEDLARRLKSDTHAAAEFRVNGVLRNVQAFYRAYNVRRGDPMWRSPARRVKIW
ncbi:MAG: M13 family metallopeptidase [Sphingomonadales bacterium]